MRERERDRKGEIVCQYERDSKREKESERERERGLEGVRVS